MSDDIVKRLRNHPYSPDSCVALIDHIETDLAEAADEIERLRAEIERLSESRAEAWQSRIRYHAFLRQIQQLLGSDGTGDELFAEVGRLVEHLPTVDLKRAATEATS